MAAELVLTLDPPEVGSSLKVAGTDFMKATLSTNLTGANNDLVFTAKEWGTPSPAITVAYVNPGAETAGETVTVTGHAISVTLRSVSGTLSTAAQVAAAIAASPSASALVSVANKAANDGSGSVIAMSAAALAAADIGTVDLAVHGPDESVVISKTGLATDGSGNIDLGESIEIENPGVIHVVATKSGEVVAKASEQVFT